MRMASQKGIFPLEGTLGGVNFYYRKGKAVARKSGGGFNGMAIKTKDSMVRVRENGSEFGSVSKVKKMIRMSVEQELLYVKDGTLHGRMMSVLQEVKVCDLISDRGSRMVWKGLKTAEGKKLLTDFLFVPKQAVFFLFASFSVVVLDGKKCDVGNLTAPQLVFKGSATHLCLHYFVVDYDVEALTFKKNSAEKVLISKEEFSGALPPFEVVDLPLTFSTRMAFLSVQFYQEKNGGLFELKENGMAGVRCLLVME